jgi:hypothetical protein
MPAAMRIGLFNIFAFFTMLSNTNLPNFFGGSCTTGTAASRSISNVAVYLFECSSVPNLVIATTRTVLFAKEDLKRN